MRQIVGKVFKSRFFRSAGAISGGAAITQLIAFASAPILTRLYSPEAYGVLALVLAFVTLGVTVASLHYELAIALPAHNQEAATLVSLAISLAAAFSLAAIPLFAPTLGNVLTRGGFSELAKYWWLLPITLFASSVHQAMIFWHLRQQRFKQVAANGVIQSLAQNGAPIALAVAGLNSAGLLLGLMISRIVGAVGLVSRSFRQDRSALKFSWRESFAIALKYKTFPTLGLLGAILHVSCYQLPIFLLTAIYGSSIAGFYMLQDRVLGVPLAVLGQGMASVFYVNAAKLAHEDVRELRRMYFKLLRNLALSGAIPAIALLLWSPWLFTTIFGPDWRTAGEFAQIMAIPTYLRFVAGPLFRCLTILRGQTWIFVCDGVGCIAMLMLPTLVGDGESMTTGVLVIAVAISLTYAGLLLASTYVVNRNPTKIKEPELSPESALRPN